MKYNTLAIVQARMGSTRFPGKVLKEIDGKPLIQILFYRLSFSKRIDKIILATSKSHENDVLAKSIEDLGFDVFRGHESDVLGRYYNAAKKYCSETIVRITGDCPMIDPQIVDDVINLYNKKHADYACNIEPPTFPDGLDTEVFSFISLEEAYEKAKNKVEREHVTPFIRTNPGIKKENLSNDVNYSDLRWTIDEPDDFQVISNIINHFTPNLNFSWRKIIDLKKSKPEYFNANEGLKRNEGIEIGYGQKLWKRAKKIIPGGNMLLSKRAEMFLPDKWPAYYDKAKGCNVWDLDGNKYIDMSAMGIGTNILGYCHPEVDETVRRVVNQGNMSTLNCPEEVYLAEKLIELHPWANMVRFARSGGEANAIAIRIARACSGKDKVVICGYHGWHDWYLATNLNSKKGLDNHLISGLKPKGVPKGLKGSILTFNYNNIDELKNIIRNHDIGVIKMEVSRSMPPKSGFLKGVREIANKNNIVLIFDECTSGFRETFGGLHKKYGIEPDMAVFGKAMGNGYAITAVIGRRDVMEAAQDTFISSTFWTERIGSAAGIKTLEIMEREKSWERITKIGKEINKRWLELGKKYNLDVNVHGLPALTGFSIRTKDWLKYKTFITQEMLKKGILATNSIYVCIDHTNNVIDKYFQNLEPIFSLISKCELENNIDDFLEGPICHSGFNRLN
ncbi:MAG: glutamate-1-semialdehyde aminotransferase [Candidatus Marinimicrobia bacterium]|nr:glutamate-1-semialdehyde aminotransferase [Candidatus Neomarinimicrobiota bacterium]|tara:strand:- start:2114 stop:4147 length:2034 start_codon:yes stop_codon:yes gene_type:complete